METKETSVRLKGKAFRAVFSCLTGQLTGVAGTTGAPLIAGNEDRYNLDGKVSGEIEDRVISQKRNKDAVTFRCVNQNLGITITKRYRIKGNVLQKEAGYIGTGSRKSLLKVSSETILPDAVCRDGFYYQPADDGYKVKTVPFMKGSEVQEDFDLSINRGAFIFFLPGKGREKVISHYRYLINGKPAYGEPEESVEAKYVKGGMRIALGLDFISNKDCLEITSHFRFTDGDLREYHREILELPAYVRHRRDRFPEWFKKAKMFMYREPGPAVDLIENPDAVVAGVKGLLGLLREDENMMLFFNHWSTSGYYPYRGEFRYRTYRREGWSKPVSIDVLKERIKRLKAISPRIKVGGYVYFHALTPGTYLFEEHPEWLLHDREGKVAMIGGGGFGPEAASDMTTGYRDYILDQMKGMVTVLGFDWIHLDSGIPESINWGRETVIQGYHSTEIYEDLTRFLRKHDKVLIQNVATTIGLWADGAYFECQQPERWEERDWRTLAICGYLAGLYRRYRPYRWDNGCYGGLGVRAVMNISSGMRSWIRGSGLCWYNIPYELAYERIIEELIPASVSDVGLKPSWWKMETENLQAEVYERGGAYIVPMVWHGKEPVRGQKVEIETAGLNFQSGYSLFSVDLDPLLPEQYYRSFDYPDWKIEYVRLKGFEVSGKLAKKYSFVKDLEPLKVKYRIVTQVPAFVYRFGETRTSLLLPENMGVRISGRAGTGKKNYQIRVTNENSRAEVISYLPKEWKGVRVKVNGKKKVCKILDCLGKKFALVEVGRGASVISLSENKTAGFEEAETIFYENPSGDYWREASERLEYENLEHRADTEDGRSVLYLKERETGKGGNVAFPLVENPVQAGGVEISIKGRGLDDCVTVTVLTGEDNQSWTRELRSNFTGWRQFAITRDEFVSSGAGEWREINNLTVSVLSEGGGEMAIAGIRFLPPRPGDFVPAKKEAKKRVIAYRTEEPFSVDGEMTGKCWEEAEPAVDFYKTGGGKAGSDSWVKICYDDQNLYLIFNCDESIETLGEKKENPVWTKDHVEIFLDPFPGKGVWYHLLVETAGFTVSNFYQKTGYLRWKGPYEVRTFLNWKAGWVAKFRIPFSSLGRVPKDGEVWGINFGRMDLVGEWLNWNTPGEFLDPAEFGEIVFFGKQGGAG
ncbi:MAG: sugar-binding protein [Candidatus Omnitrophota bacterium]